MSTRTALRRVTSTVTGYIGAVMGDHDYQRYVEHHRRNHPGTHLLSEREYWRERHEAMEKNPRSRCC